ncbi:MAG TPA: c-type cytochrome [Gammaproteobacteria bacterium]|nr:c-type cytochrome [Gammaproteobacteria bacterium]
MYSYFYSQAKLGGIALRFIARSVKWIVLGLSLFFTTLCFADEAANADKYAEVPYPPVNYGTGPQADSIKRGEYLVKAGDCIACHTNVGGKPFAGGLPIKTPFGTMYVPNITSDQETGIGNWSDDDFVRAMHEGISKKGHYYFPAFPFMYFDKMSRQDVLDIRAYLNAIPAVHQPNRPLDMPWPFSWRELQSFSRFLFFDFSKGEFQPDLRKSPEWNRGAFLVEGPGHCAMCHSPLNFFGFAKKKYDLTGGFVDGYSAPNISASGLKDVPTQKILDVFLKDQKYTGGMVQGPMLQVNHDSLRYLSVDDLNAIVTYLRTVESKMPPAPSVGTGAKAGEAIYQKYCAGCHMSGGGGAPKFGDSSQWAPFLAAGMDKVYTNAIHGVGGMPPKGNCDSCTDDQVKNAVDYIVNNSKGTAGQSQAAAPAVQSLTSLQKGKEVYTEVCSVCHTNGQLGAPKLGDKEAWTPILQNNLDVLIERSIKGYKGHPPMGACYQCSDADIISAVKYMAQESGTGNYKLW